MNDYDVTAEVVQQAITVVVSGTGPQGPAGNGDLTYVTSFANLATVNVSHRLGKYPSVTVFDSSGDEVEGDVYYTDLNNLRLVFSAAFSGTIVCN